MATLTSEPPRIDQGDKGIVARALRVFGAAPNPIESLPPPPARTTLPPEATLLQHEILRFIMTVFSMGAPRTFTQNMQAAFRS
jgi:hypothetical protein